MPDRSVDVDGLRAFALLGICIVNVPFLGLPMADLLKAPTAPVDVVVAAAVAFFAEGKFFLLFSFLFGWTFGLQMAGSARRGGGAGGTHARRLFGLALFGVLNAVFAFYGDILLLYAMLGILLWFARNWTPRALLWAAAGWLGVAALALMLIAASFDGFFVGAPGQTAERSGYLGSFADGVRQRVSDWTRASGFIALFNGPGAAAAFCAGLAAYKVSFFDRDNAVFERLARTLPWLLIPALLGNGLYVLAFGGQLGTGAGAMLGVAALAVGGPALAAIYLVGVVRAVRSGWLSPGFTRVGQISLTAYIGESVVSGLIFNGYGLGWFGQVGRAGLLVIAIAIYVIVHLAGAAWLRLFAVGPLERLQRAITHGR